MDDKTDPAACFARCLAALDGDSVPLSSVGSKMLFYMLHEDGGCDAWITPNDLFVVQYGWHLSHHRYYADVAPEVTSWLFDELGARRGVLAEGVLPSIDGFPVWGRARRAVWIEVAPEKITILVRDAASDELPGEVPAPIEPPIEYVAAAEPCPSCGQVPDRYRKLRDGSLVCLACGASRRAGQSPQ